METFLCFTMEAKLSMLNEGGINQHKMRKHKKTHNTSFVPLWSAHEASPIILDSRALDIWLSFVKFFFTLSYPTSLVLASQTPTKKTCAYEWMKTEFSCCAFSVVRRHPKCKHENREVVKEAKNYQGLSWNIVLINLDP